MPMQCNFNVPPNNRTNTDFSLVVTIPNLCTASLPHISSIPNPVLAASTVICHHNWPCTPGTTIPGTAAPVN